MGLTQGAVAIVQALVWPSVVVVLIVSVRREIGQFLINVSEFRLKGPGFEASASTQHQFEAAVSLGAAAAKPPQGSAAQSSPEIIESRIADIASMVRHATPRFLAGASILWVDDIPQNNVYERRALEALGVLFTPTTSTTDALVKLQSDQFDAVISDMSRPPDPRAGYTLLGEMQKRGIRVAYIIYSSSDRPEHKTEALAKGAIGSTSRPEELFALVIEALSGDRSSKHALPD
jgi:CheY-like chemotaxis protein